MQKQLESQSEQSKPADDWRISSLTKNHAVPPSKLVKNCHSRQESQLKSETQLTPHHQWRRKEDDRPISVEFAFACIVINVIRQQIRHTSSLFSIQLECETKVDNSLLVVFFSTGWIFQVVATRGQTIVDEIKKSFQHGSVIKGRSQTRD